MLTAQNNNAQARVIFQRVNNSPTSDMQESCYAKYVVNALTIALHISWEEAVRRLTEQAHALCLMPADKKCVRAMLEKSGFVLQPGKSKNYTVEDICREMSARCHDGQTAIAIGTYSHVAALCPVENHTYGCVGSFDMRNWRADELWVHWSDGQDHSPVPRRRGRKSSKPKPERHFDEHTYFHCLLQNPAGNYIGDCVVRGIASILGISWHEAVDALMQCRNYERIVINAESVFEKLLQDQHYVKHAQLRIGGRALTAKRFCTEMNRMYHNGEHIFAFVGRSHVAAILPIERDGVTAYRVEDSWDSTDRTIGPYWVERRTVKPAKEPVVTQLQYEPGQWLVHPRFGMGCVVGVDRTRSTTVLEIRFSGETVKRLAESWVRVNCEPA